MNFRKNILLAIPLISLVLMFSSQPSLGAEEKKSTEETKGPKVSPVREFKDFLELETYSLEDFLPYASKLTRADYLREIRQQIEGLMKESGQKAGYFIRSKVTEKLGESATLEELDSYVKSLSDEELFELNWRIPIYSSLNHETPVDSTLVIRELLAHRIAPIGEGKGNMVFRIGPDSVLKVSKNAYGRAEIASQVRLSDDQPDVVAVTKSFFYRLSNGELVIKGIAIQEFLRIPKDKEEKSKVERQFKEKHAYTFSHLELGYTASGKVVLCDFADR